MNLKEIEVKNKELTDWNILSFWRGSMAHGTYVPKENPDSIDDKDLMYVIVPPIDYYFGLKTYGSHGTKEIGKGTEWDIVVYELKKYIGLLLKGNPNVLCGLWMPDHLYTHISPEGQMLIDNRSLFATKQVYHSFIGYAYGQLSRMERFSFQGYMGEKRKQLVEKFGYDCKNGSHLIRLLRMGMEFLVEGELYVQRKDAKELVAIKKGEWTLDEVKREADILFEKIRDVYTKSPLPPKPDISKVNKLMQDIFCERFKIEDKK